MAQAFSYAFTPFPMEDGSVIMRPMLYVVLKKDAQIFETSLLLDSGADFSMLRRDVARDGLKINIDRLKQKGTSYGIVGETPVGIVDIEITFRYKQRQRIEMIPFQVSLDPKKEPPENILGRNPFFYKYRIDFRMGYTDDPTLGKFWLYPEEKKRDSKAYKRPMKFRR